MFGNTTYRQGSGRTRFRTLLWPCAVGIPLLGIILWFMLSLKPEPLTSEEILAKKQWTEPELTDSLARAFAPTTNRRSRDQVLEHLGRQLKSYPPEKQEEIRDHAVAGAVRETLRQVRAMPADQQTRMIEAMRTRAETSLLAIARKNNPQAELNRQLNSARGKAFGKEVSRVVLTELTPDERRLFAPVTELWFRIIQEAQK